MDIEYVRSRFIKHFDGTTGAVYASPGRINLIGEHTDYNGGFVFPGAIDKGMIAEIKPNGTSIVKAYSIDLKDYVEFGLNEEDAPRASWARSIFGVCREMMKRGVDVKGVNTCLDTSGNPFTREEPFYSKFEKLMEVTDLFMLDIKEIDEDEHKKLTGQTNKNILDMATCLSDHGKAMWIRHVLVPGITDDDGQLHRLRAFIDTLKTVERVEILPYHTLGVFKWKELGIPYALEDVEPPTKEQVEHAREIIIPGYKS